MITIVLIAIVMLVTILGWYTLIRPLDYYKRMGVKQTNPWPLLGDQWPVVLQKLNPYDLCSNVYYLYSKCRYVGYYQFNKPVLMLRDPELIKELTVKEFDNFTDHIAFTDPDTEPIWASNLFALKGEKWKEMRVTLSGTFTSSKMKHMFETINDVAINFVHFFLSKNADLIAVEMKDIFTRYTNDVIATAAFGIKVDSLKQPTNTFYSMGKQITNFTGLALLKMSIFVIFPKIFKFCKMTLFADKVINYFRIIIHEAIKARKEQGIVRKDMIHLLLETRKGIKHNDEYITEIGFATVKASPYLEKSRFKQIKQLSNDDITSQAFIFFLAGFDTISTGLSFGLHEIAVNPNVQNRLRKEIQEAHKANNEKLSYNSLLKLKYLDNVFSAYLKMILLFLLAVLGYISSWYYFVRPLKSFARNGVKQTKPWPLLGDQWPLMFKRISLGDWILEKYNMFPKSRYFGYYQFTNPTVMIKDPELVKQLTVKDFDHFTDHRSFVDPESEPIWGNNLFSLEGQRWKDMRATLSGSFTSSKIKHMFDVINEAAGKFVEHFRNSNKEIVSLEMKGTYSRYTTDVIASAAFGLKVDSIGQPENTFYLMGKQVTSALGFFARLKIALSVIVPKIFKFFRLSIFNAELTAYFKNIIYETIKMREEEKVVRKDMINLLLESRNGVKRNDESVADTGFATVKESSYLRNHKPKQLKQLTNDDITSQALIFFLAGMETTSTALGFGTYELAINPEIQQKLRKEIQMTHSANDRKVTYESLLGMKYMDQVFTEILRKWPPGVLLSRTCTKPYTIEPKYPDEKPLNFKAGDLLNIAVFGIHRDEQYYPNPDKFDPERFSDENKDSIVPYTFLPFGAGPRNCIGSRFAILEAKALLYHLLLNFEIVTTGRTQIPLKLSKDSLRHQPEGGIWLGLKPL